MYACQALGVSKTYGSNEAQVNALQDLTVCFEPGRFTAVMGASGSGKSTLLNSLSGLDSVDKGQVFVAGQDLSQLSGNKRTIFRRTHVGFVFQAFNLVSTLTARDNILLPSALSGQDVDQSWFEELTTTLQIADRLGHKPTELSGGQQQKVALARALLSRPAVVFADEPTGNLDSRSAHEVIRLLREATDSWGQTLVMVTHDPAAAALADRVVFLVDGSVHSEILSPTLASLSQRLEEVLA